MTLDNDVDKIGETAKDKLKKIFEENPELADLKSVKSRIISFSGSNLSKAKDPSCDVQLFSHRKACLRVR